MHSRTFLRLVSLLLLTACSDDDSPPATTTGGGAAGMAGQTATAGSGGSSQSQAGSAGTAGTAGMSGSAGMTPTSGGTLTATLDGQEVPAEGEPYVGLMLSSTKLFIARGKSTTAPYIDMVFQNNDGFTKPLVLPPATNGTQRQSHINMNGAEYWASRQGSTTTDDQLQVVDGRLKGTWTYTSRPWGNGTGDPHTVVITADLPLPPSLQ